MIHRFNYFSLMMILLSLCVCGGCDKSDDLTDNEIQVVPDDENDNIGNSTFSNTVIISFGASLSVSNPLDDKGVSIKTNGNEVIVSSTVEEVEYILTGYTSNGFVKIYSDYKCKLILDDIHITNPTGPAINIQSGKRVFVELATGTQNTLTDGSSYNVVSGEDMKAAFFSEGQLIFTGTGSLQVNGNYKHGICSDDYVRIYEGDITIYAAVSDGIHTNDAFVMDGGTLNITAATDGIECEKGYIIINDGYITLKTGDDGIITSYEESDRSIIPYMEIHKGTINITTTGISAKAIKSMGDLLINDGEITIKTTQREAEGIESKNELTINGGDIHIEAYDDCINASNSIVINGGDIYCYSTANDGIDSNGTLTITGGNIVAIGTSAPEEGIDCDQNTFKITGGTILGIGGATSTPTSNVCTQRSVIYGGSGTLNSLFEIKTSSGKEILSYNIPRTLQQMTLLFSSSNLETGSYVIYSDGSQKSTFTISSMVTTIGSVNGPGGNPGRPGGW